MEKVFIHPTAEVEEGASIGPGTRIWHQAQVRTGAHVGSECNVGKGVYVDFGVTIGNRVKIQFHTVIGHGVTIEDGVMVGPNVSLCNDDWEIGPVLIRYGASIGANAVIIPGVTVGSFAMVGAGSVVTHSVPDYA